MVRTTILASCAALVVGGAAGFAASTLHQGPRGLTGARGPVGTAGALGPQGPAGAAGTDGQAAPDNQGFCVSIGYGSSNVMYVNSAVITAPTISKSGVVSCSVGNFVPVKPQPQP